MSAEKSTTTGTRATSVPAIERATGRDWASWLKLFAEHGADTHGAEKLGHAKIAKIARAALPDDMQSVDWWAQGVAIAFEQHMGLRVPGQGSDGLFRVSASRTLPLDRDAAIDAWVAAHGDGESHGTEHRGFTVQKPRRSRTQKRSFWRFDLDGMGRVDVSATPKGDDRVTLGISHDGMPSGEDIEQWRAYWKELLAALSV